MVADTSGNKKKNKGLFEIVKWQRREKSEQNELERSLKKIEGENSCVYANC